MHLAGVELQVHTMCIVDYGYVVALRYYRLSSPLVSPSTHGYIRVHGSTENPARQIVAWSSALPAPRRAHRTRASAPVPTPAPARVDRPLNSLYTFRQPTGQQEAPYQLATMEDLTEDMIKEFEQAFQLFDKDGNGMIEAKELADVLNALGQSPSEEDIDKMMREIDGDRNGTIEFSEFLTMMASKMRVVDNEEEIQEAFKVFDMNADGFITIEELAQSMASLNESFTKKEIQEMVKVVGSEGKVNYNQFKNMMLSSA